MLVSRRMSIHKEMVLRVICYLLFFLFSLPMFWLHSLAVKIPNNTIKWICLLILWIPGILNDFIISPFIEKYAH